MEILLDAEPHEQHQRRLGLSAIGDAFIHGGTFCQWYECFNPDLKSKMLQEMMYPGKLYNYLWPDSTSSLELPIIYRLDALIHHSASKAKHEAQLIKWRLPDLELRADRGTTVSETAVRPV